MDDTLKKMFSELLENYELTMNDKGVKAEHKHRNHSMEFNFNNGPTPVALERAIMYLYNQALLY